MELELTTSTRIAYARAWCEEVAYSYDIVKRKEESFMYAQATMDGIKGVRYDGVGAGGGMEHGDDAMAARVQQVERDRHEAAMARLDAMDASREFDMALDRMRNQTYARLLAMRYESRGMWKDIADQLGYSESNVKGYMHLAALVELYDFMPESRKIPQAV